MTFAIGSNRLTEILRCLRYKPGWNITFVERPSFSSNGNSMLLVIDYMDVDVCRFQSEQDRRIENVRFALERSNGFDPPEVGKWRYHVPIREWDLADASDEKIIQIIASAIRQVEEKNFERWFRFESSKVFK